MGVRRHDQAVFQHPYPQKGYLFAGFLRMSAMPSELELDRDHAPTRGREGAEMPTFIVRSLTASFVLALTIAACDSTGPDQLSVWGSNEAGLTVADSRATLQILASGGCYGSYGEIDQPIPSGTFTLSGTYTQLTGVYPGSVQYAAQYVGTVAGRHMTLSITVPALQQLLGPFSLTQGVAKTWPPCLYP